MAAGRIVLGLFHREEEPLGLSRDAQACVDGLELLARIALRTAARPRRHGRGAELHLSDGVVNRFLKGNPTQIASPIERLPLGVPTLLTHGGRDDIVPVEISERFARESGATLIVEPDEDHFGHLDPDNPLWQAVIKWL